jgi:hypothetical protein
MAAGARWTAGRLTCVTRVWVSGPAVNDDYGTMNYELGETPDPALAALQNGGSISV